MKLGTNNRATIVGMMAGLKFLQELGPENVYRRIHELAKYNESLARQREYIEVLSSPDERLYGSLTCIGFKGADLAPMWKKLRSRRIWTIVTERLRISTHIHTRKRDLEEFYGTLDEVFVKGRG
jgi:selenocysteine lyase/cysteine desulfurase